MEELVHLNISPRFLFQKPFKLNRAVFLLLLTLLISGTLSAQQRRSPDRRFDAGLTLGVNAAQIDGDFQAGYKKLGLSAGVRAEAAISPRFYLSFELLYSQRGSRPKSDTRLAVVDMDLNFVEAPVLVHLRINKAEARKLATYFQFGASYGRLMNYKIREGYPGSFKPAYTNESSFEEIGRNFNGNNLSFLVGGSVYFSPRLSLNARHSYSMVKLFENSSIEGKTNLSMRTYHFNLQFNYALYGIDRIREKKRKKIG